MGYWCCYDRYVRDSQPLLLLLLLLLLFLFLFLFLLQLLLLRLRQSNRLQKVSLVIERAPFVGIGIPLLLDLSELVNSLLS